MSVITGLPTITPQTNFTPTYPAWSGVAGKPYIVVTPNGPGDGGDFGPNTPGTKTSGIQEAINALPSSGGTIIIREGIYYLTSPVDLSKRSNFTIRGRTMPYGDLGTTIKAANNSNIALFSNINGSPTRINVIIDSLLFDGNYTNNPSGSYLVNFNNCQYFRITNCGFTQSKTHAINLVACRFFSIDHNAIGLDGVAALPNTDNQGNGINIDGASPVWITNNIIENNVVGIYVTAASAIVEDMVISGNQIVRHGSHGIEFVSTTANALRLVKVFGNQVNENGGDGIHIDGSVGNSPTWIHINNCQIIDNGFGGSPNSADGVSLNKGSAIIITGCTIIAITYNTQRYGVNAVGAGTFAQIMGNNFINNNTGAIGNISNFTNQSIIINNIGFNPQPASSITVGASPFTYTNNDPYPELVVISGGTVSAVSLKRGTTSIASVPNSQQVYLAQGDSVVVTYTAAPTMEKFPL